MSRVDGDTFVIARARPEQCDLCGAIAELRPYGPRGEWICFDCAARNPEATDRALLALLARERKAVADGGRR